MVMGINVPQADRKAVVSNTLKDTGNSPLVQAQENHE
jgi:hypothetical protein